jgi:microcystin-dependent protein
MSNYTKATNFASKDALSTGNPAKVIKGTEIDAEYTAIASAISSKADSNSPTFTGTPLAPTASAGTNTTQIASTAFVATAVAAAIPSGGIIIWSGSAAAIPTGWVLCNGSNSTPDLRDKFVVGAGSTYAVGDTGGSANAIVVSHTHTATTASDGTHNHDVVGTKSDGYTIYGADKFYTVSSGGPSQYVDTIKSTGIANAGSHTHSITVASAGSSGTNANLPPYYALCYIMKT